MKQHRIFFTIMLFTSYLALGQTKNIDSLKNVLENFASGKQRLKNLISYNYEFLNNYMKMPKGTMDEAEKLAIKLKDSVSLAEIYGQYGSYYENITEYETATKYLIKSISIAEKFSDKRIEEYSLNLLAIVYSRTNNIEKAEEIFRRLINIAKSKNNQNSIIKYSLNLSNFYISFGRFSNAEKILEQLLKKNIENNFYRIVALNTLSFLYNSTNRPQNGLEKAKEALRLYENGDNLNLKTEILTNMANAYYGLGQFTESLKLNEQIIEISSKNNMRLQKDNAYGNLYLNYEAQGDYKNALAYFKKYYELKDSLVNENLAKQINELHVKYETEKKEAEIQSQKKEIHLNSVLMNAYLTIIVISLLLISVIVYFYLKQKSAYKSLVKVNLSILKEQKKIDSIKEKIKTALGEKVIDNFDLHEIINHPSHDNSKNHLISDETKFSLLTQLNNLIEQKIYLRKDLSLENLAGELKTNTKYLSQIIHEIHKTNFPNFINELRINEARKMLCNSEYDNYSIEGIANTVGFNSKQSFNQAFKKVTGLTPSFYKNQVSEEHKLLANEKSL